MDWNLMAWLGAHSLRSERIGGEEVFFHATGHKSIIVRREGWIDGIANVEKPTLSGLYEDMLGASIGDGQIIVGTPVVGGVEVSMGFTIPDLDEMEAQAKELGMNIRPSQHVFMMEACWMFLYSVEQRNGNEVLLRYDRDFRREDDLMTFDVVLDEWWQMLSAETKAQGNQP
jgi:hypothetical protein